MIQIDEYTVCLNEESHLQAKIQNRNSRKPGFASSQNPVFQFWNKFRVTRFLVSVKPGWKRYWYVASKYTYSAGMISEGLSETQDTYTTELSAADCRQNDVTADVQSCDEDANHSLLHHTHRHSDCQRQSTDVLQLECFNSTDHVTALHTHVRTYIRSCTILDPSDRQKLTKKLITNSLINLF